MNNMPINIYPSKKSLIIFLLMIVFTPALFTISDYLRGDMSGAYFWFIITLIEIFLVVFYAYIYPDKWKLPLFIIDGNDLIVQYLGTERSEVHKWEKVKWRNKIHIRIDADRKNRLKYLNEINNERYELIFDSIKPKSIEINLQRISEADKSIMRNFIFSNYREILIPNKSNTADR